MPREEWASAQGKKVDTRRCVKAIEAQPLFGQIKPSRGHVVRALNSISGEVLANSVVLYKMSLRPGVETATKAKE